MAKLYTPINNITNTFIVDYSGNTQTKNLVVSGNSYIQNGSLILRDYVWDDLRFPPSSLSPGATAGGDILWASTGLRIKSFSPTTTQSFEFVAQLPHSWVTGTSLSPHFHWCPTTTATGTVIFGLEYIWLSIGESGVTSTTITGLTYASGATYNWKHQLFDLPIIPDGKGLSSCLIGRIFRDHTDTYPDEVGLIEFDIHYQMNRLGSDEEYNNVYF